MSDMTGRPRAIAEDESPCVGGRVDVVVRGQANRDRAVQADGHCCKPYLELDKLRHDKNH